MTFSLAKLKQTEVAFVLLPASCIVQSQEYPRYFFHNHWKLYLNLNESHIKRATILNSTINVSIPAPEKNVFFTINDISTRGVTPLQSDSNGKKSPHLYQGTY